jgi:DNA polymerase III sliding clamp (beta) subunit (PCNA family)
MTTVNRTNLLKCLQLARPALSSQDYIPAYSHFRVAGGEVTAYNDVSAIAVTTDLDLDVCLPGDLLIKTLGTFTATDVALARLEAGAYQLSSGRSKIKLPTIAVADFPLKWPKESADPVVLDDGILRGIELCLPGVGSDPSHPAQMGVTLDEQGEHDAVLFATDNATITRYVVKSDVALPGSSPVILPTFFCEQLLALAKAFPKAERLLHVLDGALVVEIGDEARLMTRQLVEIEALDFRAVLRRSGIDDSTKKKAASLPPGWDSALQRAMLVMAMEVDKVVTLGIAGDQLEMTAKAATGELSELLEFDGDIPTTPVRVDPALMLRASRACTGLQVGKSGMVMFGEGGSLLTLVSYYG